MTSAQLANQSRHALRVPFLILWTLILSAFTAVLSGAPLKVLRNVVGPIWFWFICICLVAAAWALKVYPVALVIAAQCILIGVYTEFEQHNFSVRQSAALSLVVSGLTVSSGFYLWAAANGKNWMATLTEVITAFLQKASQMNIQMIEGIKPEVLIAQIPSAVAIFLVLSLAFSLIFERTIFRWVGLTLRRKERLSDFSVFDAMIWFFIVSLLGTFSQTGIKAFEIVSLNIFNLCVAIYFFQGLAILSKYFEIFRVGAFWRALWVFLLVIQLPIVLSLVGVVDLWADFRKVFSRRAANLRKKVEE